MKKRWFSLGIVLVLIFLLPLTVSVQAAPPHFLWNGEWTVAHARLILQHLVGKATLTGEERYWLDQDWDGELAVADARTLLQKLVGKWVPDKWTEQIEKPLYDFPFYDPLYGKSIDFQVMSYTTLKNISPDSSKKGMYIVRSLSELKEVYPDNLEIDPNIFNEKLFENKALIIMIHSVGSISPYYIFDSIIKENDYLIMGITEHCPNQVSYMWTTWLFAFAVNRKDINGVSNMCWYYNEEIFYSRPSPSFRNTLDKWLADHGYEKQPGDSY